MPAHHGAERGVQYPGPQGEPPSDLAPRGTKAATTMREAVADIEVTWSRRLGPERFSQLRTLLRELAELNHRI